MSVDFPDPFSPTSPTASPAVRVSCTSSRTTLLRRKDQIPCR